MIPLKKILNSHVFPLAGIAILVAGLLLRVLIFLQNRNFILDEVNLVRNIHERNYFQLLKPLDYQQFAPVPFIVLSKAAVTVFGAYEWAVRLYPFACGLLALSAFYLLLKKLHLLRGGIYPLLLMATGLIYVRYATEFKQYSSDQLISTCLLIAAIDYGPRNTPKAKFLIIWSIIGSLAVWISMPSVFILAGVGGYFLLQVWGDEPARKRLPAIFMLFGVWIAHFLVNYIFFLKPAIRSEYLQNWHQSYFLTWITGSKDEWGRNMDALSEFWSGAGGHWALSFTMNLILFFAGIYYLARTSKSLLVLFLLPIILLLLAVSLHQYTLLPRVTLFSYPLLLTLMGYGFEHLVSGKKKKILAPVIILSCLITVINFNCLKYLFTPLKFEWTTDNLEWIRAHHVPPDKVFVHETGWQQYQYYLSIRPDSNKWADMKGISPFYWHTNLDSLCNSIQGRAVFAFSWIDANEWNNCKSIFSKYFTTPDSAVYADRRIYLELKK